MKRKRPDGGQSKRARAGKACWVKCELLHDAYDGPGEIVKKMRPGYLVRFTLYRETRTVWCADSEVTVEKPG